MKFFSLSLFIGLYNFVMVITDAPLFIAIIGTIILTVLFYVFNIIHDIEIKSRRAFLASTYYNPAEELLQMLKEHEEKQKTKEIENSQKENLKQTEKQIVKEKEEFNNLIL